MTLSPNQAADTLQALAATERRSAHAYGYLQASPDLILWGVLWVVGYGLTDVWPRRAAAIWIAIITIGLIAGFLIEFRAARRIDAHTTAAAGSTRHHAAAHAHWM